MGTLRTTTLGALGSLGQNTEASQIDLPPDYALSAVNCFLDENRRLTARPSMVKATATNGDLPSSSVVERVYRHNLADGSTVLICAGNNRIFSSTSTTLTSRGSGYSGNRWQFATLNGKLFAAQAAHLLRYFNESTWAETTVATPDKPRAIHVAYGRLWALSSDGWTLYWSDLLDGTNFTSGASGSLDISKIHSTLRSPAVAVASFNRQIVVLCRDAIVVLGLANDLNPNNSTTPIYLVDHIPGIGTIARDSVVSTGDDLLFLADDGLRSLSRSLAEKQGPAPLTDVSALNTRSLLRSVASETAAAIASAWNPQQAWYQLFLPTLKEVWTFDLSVRDPQTRAPAVTVWRMGTRPVNHATYWADDQMYFSGNGGLYKNATYDATDTYTYSVETGWLPLGAPDAKKHLKALLLNVKGGNGQDAQLRWYVDFNEDAYRTRQFSLSDGENVAEFGSAEFNSSEYAGGVTVVNAKVQIGGTAKFVKFVLEFPVEGGLITLNNAQVQLNMGRLA